MAVAFEIGTDHYGYGLDRGEEILLVDAFLTARGNRPNEPWAQEFERRFFGSDRGVSERLINAINERLDALGKSPVRFSPSGHTDYTRMRGEPKIAARQDIRRKLLGPEREETLRLADIDNRLLPAAHSGALWPEEIRSMARKAQGWIGSSDQEVARRRAALDAPVRGHAPGAAVSVGVVQSPTPEDVRRAGESARLAQGVTQPVVSATLDKVVITSISPPTTQGIATSVAFIGVHDGKTMECRAFGRIAEEIADYADLVSRDEPMVLSGTGFFTKDEKEGRPDTSYFLFRTVKVIADPSADNAIEGRRADSDAGPMPDALLMRVLDALVRIEAKVDAVSARLDATAKADRAALSALSEQVEAIGKRVGAPAPKRNQAPAAAPAAARQRQEPATPPMPTPVTKAEPAVTYERQDLGVWLSQHRGKSPEVAGAQRDGQRYVFDTDAPQP